MTTLTTLPAAIAELVEDGATLALEGFTHLIPVAAGQEIIRQGRRDLTVVRMTPDIVYDQMIGAGCVRKLIFSWGGNPGVGSLHRFRDAVENGWPRPLEIEEHSHAGMANRYAAGAAGLPFAVLRGYRGTDLAEQTPTLAPITCPFTGEELTAVPAINPDVSIIHAQQADHAGNVMLWGIIGVQKEAAARGPPGPRDRRGDRRRARTAGRGRSSSPRGRCRTSPPSPAARIRATPRATRRATTTTTATGTASRRTATASPPGWTPTCWAPPRSRRERAPALLGKIRVRR